MFSSICTWINGWVNNGEVGDLRRHRAHCDVTVVIWRLFKGYTWYKIINIPETFFLTTGIFNRWFSSMVLVQYAVFHILYTTRIYRQVVSIMKESPKPPISTKGWLLFETNNSPGCSCQWIIEYKLFANPTSTVKTYLSNPLDYCHAKHRHIHTHVQISMRTVQYIIRTVQSIYLTHAHNRHNLLPRGIGYIERNVLTGVVHCLRAPERVVSVYISRGWEVVFVRLNYDVKFVLRWIHTKK